MVFITGLARSGTSAIAGIAHYLGVDMGEYYLCPDTQNPLGYFEDAKYLEINFKYYEKDKEMWKKLMSEYLKTRTGLWGVKDPTFSVTHRDLKPLLFEPKYILCERNEEDVKKSRKKHYGKTNNPKTHKKELEKALENETVLRISYEDTLKNPEQTVKSMVEYIGISPTEDQITRAILSIIQPPPQKGNPTLAVPSKLYKS